MFSEFGGVWGPSGGGRAGRGGDYMLYMYLCVYESLVRVSIHTYGQVCTVSVCL